LAFADYLSDGRCRRSSAAGTGIRYLAFYVHFILKHLSKAPRRCASEFLMEIRETQFGALAR